MFNFVDSKLTPKILCRSAAMDNYEVENLISNNYLERKRGFIAYSAIKPPVEIEITFICPVNIHYIVLNTTVGSQRCSGIEIFAKTSVLDYTSICRYVYDKEGIFFGNSRKYSKTNIPPDYNDDYYQIAFFKSNTFKSFLNACSIKIVIFRTVKSVPCLGAVEVWGTPSRSCSERTMQTLSYLMGKSNETSTNTNEVTSNASKEDFKIPDDFKDDLTYEIMSLPMTLPSGKTVDQSTLEKHIESEISFGRKPCDPFTGIKFTDKIKPVFNVALKSRIDMFLLQNSYREELLNVKRTLGRGSVSTSLRSEAAKKRKTDHSSSDLDEVIFKAKQGPNFISFTSDNVDVHVCSNCGISFQNAFYKIPCEHKYCRLCILEVCKVLKCSLCNNLFIKSDVRKCNL